MDRFPTSSARLAARLAFTVLLATCASLAVAGGPQALPTPAATPTPPPAGGAGAQTVPSPTPVPVADDTTTEAPAAVENSTDPAGMVNPGGVAFTDYRPFDLESIEPQSFASKWEGFTAGVRGLTRYSLFDGKVKFRLGGRAQVDGTVGSGSDRYEASFRPIDSTVDLRRGAIFAVGRIKQFNFNLAVDFGADWGVDDAWIEGSQGGL
ncbi:MAG TPA: hypothetical protein VLT32_23705, partial [Candidatus Sulfomarinibacteraceae bacterium]|nr:hypothetical protein [Candidatus Sulfomarinibacteraceae bacterium]